MKSIKKLFAGFLALVLVIAMIPVALGVKEAQAAETTVIIAPGNYTLVAAGYIKIVWKAAGGSIKNYELYVDNQKVTTTQSTEYEYYATKVKRFDVHVKTVYSNGSSANSESSCFYVTKKGLAVNDNMGRNLSPLEMNMGWYYTWGTTAFSYTTYRNAEFVPMQWGTGNEANNINNAVNNGYRYFLGYNEPDMGGDVGGSNMSVQTALNNWPGLCGKDIHLGSPAPALCPAWSNGTWFRSFMESVDQDSFEFIPLHCYYGTYGGAEAAQTFLTEVVDGTWNMYHKKIWVTEFAISGWGYNNASGRKSVKEFMEAVIQGLNERDYVERYSWFSFDTTDNNNGASALWNKSTGELTELGQVYVNEGNPEGYDYQYVLQNQPYFVSVTSRDTILPDAITINDNSYEDYVAKSGVSIVASSELGNNRAANAIDDDIKSRWESTQGIDPQSVTIDLGEVRNIKQVDVVWEAASAAKYNIEISNDGVNFESVATVSSGQGGRCDVIEFTQLKSAKYVKIHGISRTTTYGYSIFDIAIYGTNDTSTNEPTTEPPTEPTTLEPETVDPKSLVQMLGYQISTVKEGYRVVCSIEPEINGKAVKSYGVVYAINNLYGTTSTNITEADMVVGSTNQYVRSYAATENAILNTKYSSSSTAIDYAQVMTFGKKNTKAFNTLYATRAYAVLEDGTYVYSDVKYKSVANLADYLYREQLMTTYESHNYLYHQILKVAYPNYSEVDFDWAKTYVSPSLG